jgi:hypothetical protein
MSHSKVSISELSKLPAGKDVDFKLAFGEFEIYKCTVPKDYFVVSLRFVLKLPGIEGYPNGAWSVFVKISQKTPK